MGRSVWNTYTEGNEGRTGGKGVSVGTATTFRLRGGHIGTRKTNKKKKEEKGEKGKKEGCGKLKLPQVKERIDQKKTTLDKKKKKKEKKKKRGPGGWCLVGAGEKNGNTQDDWVGNMLRTGREKKAKKSSQRPDSLAQSRKKSLHVPGGKTKTKLRPRGAAGCGRKGGGQMPIVKNHPRLQM